MSRACNSQFVSSRARTGSEEFSLVSPETELPTRPMQISGALRFIALATRTYRNRLRVPFQHVMFRVRADCGRFACACGLRQGIGTGGSNMGSLRSEMGMLELWRASKDSESDGGWEIVDFGSLKFGELNLGFSATVFLCGWFKNSGTLGMGVSVSDF